MDASTDERADSPGADAGAPLLDDLGVVATEGAPAVALVPPFSPHVFDYYVRCAAGTNQLTVSMAASPGASSLLVAPRSTPRRPKQTVVLGVNEGQAFVAAAANGAATTEYWVRCLPHDFPTMKWTSYPEAGGPTPGYYLVGNFLEVDGVGAYAVVLDGNGVPVWYARQTGGSGVMDVDEVVDGSVSFVPTYSPPRTPFEIRELSPWKLQEVAPDGEVVDEHELRRLPSGDYLVLSNPIVTGVDLTGLTLSVPLPDGGLEPLGPDSNIEDCNVVQFHPNGDVVWKWTGTDHFDPAKDSTFRGIIGGATGPDGGVVIDAFHCNSIDVDPANGNLLVSSRNMDSVFYVDRSTSAVLWKMGGQAASKDHATFVPVADPFYRQHDARLAAGWSATCNGGTGQVSVFDDHSFETGVSRAVIYDVVVGASDGGTSACSDGGEAGATVAWQWKGKVTATATGSFRVLPDGSRVIGWGLSSSPSPTFSEVTADGRVQIEFTLTGGNTTYRAIKVPLAALDLGALRATSGRP
jgi:hypothetical protein